MTENNQLSPVAKLKGVADIVFCIDSTGSMKNTIDGVKDAVNKLVEGLRSDQQKNIQWRARVIGFRDFLVDAEPLIEHPFTEDINEFRSQVASLVADGGGDEEESVLDAIFIALKKSSWRDRSNKAVIVLTDAGTHPELYEKNVEPGQARDLEEVKNAIYASRAMVFLVAPKHTVYESLITVERFIYKETKEQGLKDIDFKQLLEFIGKTVTGFTEVKKD